MKVKRLTESAKLPKKAHAEDAGYDLYADEEISLGPEEWATIKTGIALDLPEGVAGLVVPRSGLAHRFGIEVVNSPGLIDPGYRGEVGVVLKNGGQKVFRVEQGMRIAQLVFVSFSSPTLEEVKELTKSKRGEEGFGSTGT